MPALTLSRARLCGSAQVPPSKSAVHRALISAALSTRPCRLMGFSFPLCDDIQATLNGITALGASVRLEENAILVTPAPAGRRSNAPTAHCHVYASASITGAVLYAYLQDYMNNDAAMLIGAGSVILIRILATRYCWNLPTATKK